MITGKKTGLVFAACALSRVQVQYVVNGRFTWILKNRT